MSEPFEIHSLRVGELYIPHGGGIMRDPVHCWLLKRGSERILVDSGMPTAAESQRLVGIGGTGGGHEGLSRALAAVGCTPADVTQVVLTHLHFDHAWNLDLFPQACVVVQRDELLHAVDPVPTQRIFYRREMLAGILARRRPASLRLVDGDLQWCEGVLLLKVPAHTPGMQVPIVTTARGTAALVSDLGDHYRYWFPADARATKAPMKYLAGDFLPSPIRSEGEWAYQAAMRRVFDAADIVVPAHDFRIPRHIPDEWFAIPDSVEGDIADIPPGGGQGWV